MSSRYLISLFTVTRPTDNARGWRRLGVSQIEEAHKNVNTLQGGNVLERQRGEKLTMFNRIALAIALLTIGMSVSASACPQNSSCPTSFKTAQYQPNGQPLNSAATGGCVRGCNDTYGVCSAGARQGGAQAPAMESECQRQQKVCASECARP